jgi:hypothetical protein
MYKISLEEYIQMYNNQKGCCAICDIYFPILRIDHDHTTNKIRGLLCHLCNTGMGLLKDNTEILQRAIKYLNKERENFYESR